jgi:crotonobetainyl-CoA:carnitine CoA-transferase CaiB-like acyl-CoA transferase
LESLDGIRVLDLSRFQACPLCGMILGDMGAEVIRIEEPKGAPDRSWGQCGPDGETLLYKVVCRNKKCATLRINTPEGREIFHELVKRSDIVLHNYTPGAPIAAEVDYEHLKGINGSIIVAALSGYGQNGPDAQRPGFDGVAQARSGGMVLTGFPEYPPIKTGLPFIDVAAGLFTTVAVLNALYHRERTGKGQAIDVSLFDTASFLTQSVGTLLLYHFYGEIRRQIGNRGFHSYNTCLPAKDGWIVLSVVTNSIWKRFVEKIGKPEMADDPRFGSDMARFHNAPLIDEVVKEWVAARKVDEIINLCEEARVPCGPVSTVDQLLTDPQVAAREMVKYFDYPGLGKIPIPGIPMKLSLTPGSIKSPSPKLGEHNEEVYCGLLGFSSEKVTSLRQEGII